MAAPSIRPIRNCLYGRHIGCTRRHSYQPVSHAIAGAPASARVQEGCARSRVHIVERTFVSHSRAVPVAAGLPAILLYSAVDAALRLREENMEKMADSMILGSRHMISANEDISVSINRHMIEVASTQKQLGITIDTNLTWEQQIIRCANIWNFCQCTSIKTHWN